MAFMAGPEGQNARVLVLWCLHKALQETVRFLYFILQWVLFPDVPLEPVAAVNETMWKMTVCNTSFLSLIRTRWQIEPMIHVRSISIFLVGLKSVKQYKLLKQLNLARHNCDQRFVFGLGSSLGSTWGIKIFICGQWDNTLACCKS